MNVLVLITGASGFVGQQVLRSLDARQYPVRAITRSPDSSVFNRYSNIESLVQTQDLFQESPDWWMRALEGVSVVVHVAWHVEPTTYLQSPQNIECLVGTVRLARAATQSNVRRFVGIGTCFEYDLSAGTLSVDTPLKPTTLYASCKASAFMTLSQLFAQSDVEFLWCRLFYLYGEGEKSGRLMPHLRQRLSAGEHAELTSGKQIRDFMDVREAGSLITELTCGETQGAVNVCSGVPTTVRQFAEAVADEYSARHLLKFGARQNNAIDPPQVLGIRNF